MKLMLAKYAPKSVRTIFEDLSETDTVESITKNVFSRNIDTLERAVDLLDFEKITQAVEILSAAECITVLGIGASATIADDFYIRLMRIGIRADDVTEKPDTNFVLVTDVSGSMMIINKLPLALSAYADMLENFDESDTISLIYYASGNGVVLENVSCEQKEKIYDGLAAKGFLDNSYVPQNASHLTKDIYKDPNGYWYGIYTGLLGFMVNRDELERMGLEAPQTWDDLLKPEYKGLIWLSNYKTAGTPKLVANLMIQLKGHDEGIQYLVDLDKNIEVYTKSGSGPSKNVGTGECVIGIGFLHDGITQIVDNGYENIQLVVPQDGTTCEIGPVAIFKGAAHPNAAKLFVEYALSPDCVELAAENGSYQFLVIDNAKQPDVVVEFGLDPSLVWDGYDFGLAVQDTAQNVEDVMAAIEGAGADVGEGRFQTS